MLDFNLILLVSGALVLFLGLVSGLLKKWGIPAPLLAMLAGVLVGPDGLGILQVGSWNVTHTWLETAARITLGVALVGVALRIPQWYFRRNWRSVAILLLPGMTMMWLTTSLLIYFLTDLPPLVALLAGAILTPTDPVVASSIVVGEVAKKNISPRVKHVISAESGLNDGLGYPFVLLPIFLLTQTGGQAWTNWFTQTVLWEVGAAVVIGAVLGYLAGKLLEWSEHQQIIEESAFLAYVIALALTTLAAVHLLNSDAVLAVFVATTFFAVPLEEEDRTAALRTSLTVEKFFILPIFALFGLLLPWQDWFEMGWTAPLLVAAIIFLRRVPELLVFGPWMDRLKNVREYLFVGWFGPMGVSAMFYAGLAMRRYPQTEVWPVVSLLVAASVVIHGLTATPFTRWFDRAQRRAGLGNAEERSGEPPPEEQEEQSPEKQAGKKKGQAGADGKTGEGEKEKEEEKQAGI